MSYDSNLGQVVLFGGDSLANGRLGDTWVWDGSFWTQMEDIGPVARRDFGMVYDTAGQVTLLFGGSLAVAGQVLGDTWQWDGTEWAQLSDSGPAPRSAHAMAFDSNRNRTVLFGGQSNAGTFLADTWEFDGQDWTQQQDTGPSARMWHSMAYDSASARVLLFGGAGADSQGLGDTWAWDGTSWVQIAEFGPPGRASGAMATTGFSVVLFGGLSPSQQVFADTWEFDGKHWTQRQDIGPGPRWFPAMAFDSVRNRVVLFGGLPIAAGDEAALTAQLLGDTWEHEVPLAVAVASVQAPHVINGGQPFTVTVNLTGPAPQGGATVGLTASVLGESKPLPDLIVAAGSTTGSQSVILQSLPIDVNLTISAQIPGTPAATTTALGQ